MLEAARTGVWTAGTVDADVARDGDMRTTMRLGHDGDDGDLCVIVPIYKWKESKSNARHWPS